MPRRRPLPFGNRRPDGILGILRDAVDELGQTVVMVTHDPGAAAHADLVLFLGDGRIVDEMDTPRQRRCSNV